ncbi:3-oxoacyl-(acyl-carrier-protein) reductase FabG [uncultured Desulfobacterium sp.]|uniref:3-oxoacyl-(Acyl-carrier-protein) reductase FabG n=1 Tax=uncultured Desulfobacterium sp. TaxID=201089 RepID=A0A445MVQ3_9BACT|nr:3-oxoacyl-(acyl-carrier-protein) reductase FabG [uncultured Desulfobacterium sp.]
MRLKDKKAVVTGAGRGIGRAVALAFAREGADVLVNYVSNSATADEVVAEIKKMGRKAIAVKADVASSADARNMIETAVKELGGLDILVNNAGVSIPAMLLKMTEEQWDRILDIHLKGAFTCTQAAANYMKNQKSGKIINVISTAGLFGTIGQINYASAKAGIIGFTKSASRELGRYNINVNAISCGVIKTDMTQKVQSDPKLAEIYTQRIQLGRFGEPDEVAHSFVFLASSESNYITGQVLPVDGGYIG